MLDLPPPLLRELFPAKSILEDFITSTTEFHDLCFDDLPLEGLQPDEKKEDPQPLADQIL